MNFNELIDECARCLKQDTDVMVCFKTSKRPKGFPRGEVACVSEAGTNIYCDPLKLLAWCRKAIREEISS
jgi:hypothetical protein